MNEIKNDNELMWKTESSETILNTIIFDVEKRKEVAASGISGDYFAINSTEWVSIIPVYKGQFILVRQYRHASGTITAEFPGGMCDRGEDPIESGRRELLEETGFTAGKLTLLGKCSPNPALFSNNIYFVLAEDLTPTNELHLDEDEILTGTLVPVDEVINSFCSGEYTNAFMGTALALYMRHINQSEVG